MIFANNQAVDSSMLLKHPLKGVLRGCDNIIFEFAFRFFVSSANLPIRPLFSS